MPENLTEHGTAETRSTVALLSFSETSGDPRVLRQVKALRGSHRLVTCGYGPAIDGADVHLRIPDSANRLPMNLLGLASLALRAHERAYACIPAARAAEELLRSAPFDVIIANDIETLPAALAASGTRPVVVDLHEFSPGQSGDWRWRVAWRPLLEAICRRDLPRATAAMTVAPGIADRYAADFGVEPSIVTNAGPFRAPQPRPVASPVRLVHHGAAQRGRRLERMIEGVGDAEGAVLDLYLVRAVRERSYLDELRKLAARFSNVRVLEPVPIGEVPELLDGYDIGLYILPPTGFNDLHALPNKFFDFVQSGLPVVIGPSPEMQALVERYGLGMVLPDWESATLRAALPGITPDRVAAWQIGVSAAARDLSAERDGEIVRAVVNRALGSGA